jgi:transposase
MDAREIMALELLADTRISYSGGAWSVPSQTSSARYRVDTTGPHATCTCDDWQLRQRDCKHILAVRKLLDRLIKGEQPPDPDSVPPRPARKTYRQEWASYNLAQTNEKDHFRVLLSDLCAGIPQPPPKGGSKGGRPPVPLSDLLFSVIFKVFSTVSARRFMSDLRTAQEREHIGRLPCYNLILRYLETAEATPILTDLITRSSLPLRSVESQFAIDSSGFSTLKYVRWVDEKYGINKKAAEWVKAHLCVGTKTQVVTAAVVGEKNSGDCPQFAPLARATAKNFTIAEMSGDKAYLSNDNLELIASLGGTPFIPFKVNSQPDGSPLWRRLFHYFSMNREDFLTHYHRRSNVESAFSMIKRKFGDAVRAKTDTAMRNEVLAKVVAHNLCVCISAWHELGIEPGEWATPKAALVKTPGESLINRTLI